MLLKEKFKDWEIILASQSPRRRELLKGLDIEFESISLDIDESYDSNLKENKITEYLCKKKADAYKNLKDRQLLITSDTIVWLNGESMEKPLSENQAKQMLSALSGNTHKVITSVGIFSTNKQEIITDSTEVTFGPLTPEEINYYVSNYKPFDKAGSYGVQEWIGYVAVKNMNGSYYTVMGLPVYKLYQSLMNY